MKRHCLAAKSGYRLERIVVNFRAGDDGYSLVKEFRQLADDAALGLPPQPEQDDVVSGEDGVDELGNNRFVVSYNAAK